MQLPASGSAVGRQVPLSGVFRMRHGYAHVLCVPFGARSSMVALQRRKGLCDGTFVGAGVVRGS